MFNEPPRGNLHDSLRGLGPDLDRLALDLSPSSCVVTNGWMGEGPALVNT